MRFQLTSAIVLACSLTFVAASPLPQGSPNLSPLELYEKIQSLPRLEQIQELIRIYDEASGSAAFLACQEGAGTGSDMICPKNLPGVDCPTVKNAAIGYCVACVNAINPQQLLSCAPAAGSESRTCAATEPVLNCYHTGRDMFLDI